MSLLGGVQMSLLIGLRAFIALIARNTNLYLLCTCLVKNRDIELLMCFSVREHKEFPEFATDWLAGWLAGWLT